MKNLEEIQNILKEINIPSFRAKQIIHAVCQQGINNYQLIKILPQAQKKILSERLPILSIKPVLIKISKNQDTQKVLFELNSKQRIEAVLMRYRDGRNSICISSQAGCQMGCKFCATGTMKFGRNLTYQEIFDQVLFFHLMLFKENKKITNIVFMGMGEPFMNYDNVLKAAYLMNNNKYLNLGARRITISTSGLADGIRKLADEKAQFNLAISLHAPIQTIREKIMPVAKLYNLEKLNNALQYYLNKTNRRVSFEYVMLDDINDTEECSVKLAKIAKNKLIHINLIPYNFTGIEGIRNSKRAHILNFKKSLQKHGVNVTIRITMGQDIDAACGQLTINN